MVDLEPARKGMAALNALVPNGDDALLLLVAHCHSLGQRTDDCPTLCLAIAPTDDFNLMVGGFVHDLATRRAGREPTRDERDAAFAETIDGLAKLALSRTPIARRAD